MGETMSVTEADIKSALSERPMTTAELAERFSMRKASMSSRLSKLSDYGNLHKEFVNPANRRDGRYAIWSLPAELAQINSDQEKG